jgi:hypothetical protein
MTIQNIGLQYTESRIGQTRTTYVNEMIAE